ncbi:MAG: right-handed parallel beta-helix repeat-containing protein, partial [Bacteroidales bacterium]|nr:right-handed parallel beta-helix repeat-containing protein [Bacteroidales bacterium]
MILKKLFTTFFSKITKILLVIILALPINGFSQSVIYVKHDAGGGNDGTSWTDAYTSLQSALENAIKDDSIWVAAGTYYPTVDKNGDPPLPAYLRTKTFQLVDSVSLYGGFDGTETNIEERDWKTNETILSGDIGTIDDKSDNSYNVTIGADSIVLDGFTITHGNANGPAIPNETNMGGGINNNNVSYVRILNCTFKDNDSDQGGGAGNYYCGDSIIFKNCVFLADTADSGGGIGNWDTKAFISQCTFLYNAATDPSIGFGGAIYNWGSGSTSEITNCTFYKNSAYQGGSIHNRGVGSSCTNSILWQNDGDAIINTNAGGCSVSYCDIDQDAYSSGTGCFDADPMLYIISEGDYRIHQSSPCIDAGNPSSPLDPDGSRADIGAAWTIFAPGIDLFVSEINSPPEQFTLGEPEVTVLIANHGSNTLTNVDIEWEVDGTPQTTKSWTGSLNSMDTSNVISLGNYDFIFGNHTIKAWTNNPTPGPDEYTGNDTSEISVYAVTNLDIGITSVVEPLNPFTFGLRDIRILFKNYSNDSTIISTSIEFEIDDVPQTTYNWTGNLPPGEISDTVTIKADHNFSETLHTIKVWTSDPNSNFDEDNTNDTLEVSANGCSPLQGDTLTIKTSGGDFTTFTDAVSYLTSTCGIEGPIVFLVESDTYNEQITIPEIPGTSENLTITFQSATGDSTDVTLSNTSGGYTVTLDGADFIIFKNMTILTDASGGVIGFSNEATNNRIMNCRITGESGSSNLIYLDYYLNSYNIFSGNRLINGTYGIYVHYRRTAGIEIKDNVFIDQTDKAIRLDEVKGATIITGNTITSNSTITGIYLYYCEDNFTIENNRISLTGGGSGIYWDRGSNNTGIPDRIVNNFIHINTDGGQNGIYMWILNNRTIEIYFNNINITGSATGSNAIYYGAGSGTSVLLKNNILANQAEGKTLNYLHNDFTSDYNCFYTNGTYLIDNEKTLEEHQSSSGQDMHSFSVDPQFISDSDLHTFNPYLNNQGTPIAEITIDIDGEARDGTNPDIGADEYDPLPPLSGSYNIGPSALLFKTFNEAVDSLIAVGIGGPVIFEVEDGTYNEQVSIPWIANSSETDTIVFISASKDSTKVILTYAASGETDNYTLKLDGAEYITFKDITLEATGAEYARVVEIGYKAHYNTFANNRLLGVLNKSELVYSYISRDTCNVFENNVFSLGIRGINMTSGSFTHGPVISGNEFIDQTGGAIYLQYYKYQKILSNYIHSDYQSTSIHLDYSRDKVEIGNNKILLPNGGNGIKLESGQWINTNDTSLIYNNFIYLNATNTGNPEYGIWLYHNYLGAKIMFNTIHITGDNSSSACLYQYGTYLNFRNNNLVNKAYGYTIYNESSGGLHSDYNNLFSNGANLTKYSADLEDWQTSYNKDLNSVSVDPYFVVDTSQHILNPALKGAGTPFVEVTEDLDGDTRDAVNPDIGADEFTLCNSPISGTFTIGGTTPDYETMNDAVEKLITCGINGPVTFNIATGTLVEQVSIQEISGASETNTITFQSETGDSSDVLITFTPINTKLNYTIRLDGADFINFKNLSISSGENWGCAVRLNNEATNNQFLNNRFFYEGTMTGSDDYAFIYSSGSLDSNNVFNSNLFENGSVGIYMNGSAAFDSIAGIQIKNNIFANIVRRGVYLQKHKNLNISGNQFEILNSTYSFGICITNSTGIIYNNFIQLETTGTGRGIYLYNCSSIPVLHNTIKITGNSSSNSYSLYYYSSTVREIKNNIFVNMAYGRAMYCDTTNLTSDYNLLYTNGSLLVQSSINYANLSAWQAATGRDTHSISREPQFLSDTDLHTTDPWLNNIGTPLAEVTTDIDGEARDPVSPDIGADEFDGIMPFEGDYTIGPTGDFVSFTEAVDTIAPVGLLGPVTFIVQSGTYNEQFVIPAIPEISETNTVTFTSASGDSTDVILQFDATTSENYTIKMDNCNFITFQNMTIKALDTTYARVVEFANGASDNNLSHNVLKSVGTANAVVYSIGDQDNNNLFEYNLIIGGKVGIQMFGESASLLESGTEITGNVFEDQFSEPILLQYQYAPLVLNNQIIHANLIEDTWAGIYLVDCSGASNNYGLLANNVIAFNTEIISAGIVLSGTSYQKVYHNSVNVFGSTQNSRAFNQEDGGSNNILKNNIFNNLSGGLVIYTRDINSFSSDYNNYYSTGDRFIYYGVSGTEYYWISDLATWQSDYSKDLNSYSVDPKFVS